MRLVEDDDLARPHVGAQLPGAFRFRVVGASHDGEAGQEWAHVQAHVHPDRGLPLPVLRPAYTEGRQQDGSGVDRANRPLHEAIGKPRVVAAGARELRMPAGKGIVDFPEELLGHVRAARPAGVGQAVAARRGAAADPRLDTGMAGEAVADVVQARRMSEIGINQIMR